MPHQSFGICRGPCNCDFTRLSVMSVETDAERAFWSNLIAEVRFVAVAGRGAAGIELIARPARPMPAGHMRRPELFREHGTPRTLSDSQPQCLTVARECVIPLQRVGI